MGVIIGMDEAGYGPNLGPLVVTATAWEVPGHPSRADLWKAFDGIVACEAAREFEHIQIADSKQVYAPARGLANLELGVLCALGLAGRSFDSLREIWSHTGFSPPDEHEAEFWLNGRDLPVPHAANLERAAPVLKLWQERCAKKGIRLLDVRSDIVHPRRFNALTREHSSKGLALSHISMQVLRQVWPEDAETPVLIIADKHGGRNTYRALLQSIVGDRFIACRKEETACSHYKVECADIRFEAKAERHFPVAMASMFSKYFRELAMVLFNRFWTERVPELKPTAGYPGDSSRYRKDIAAMQRQLGITDEALWRER